MMQKKKITTEVINSFKGLKMCLCLGLRDYIRCRMKLGIMFVRIPSGDTRAGES